MIFFNFITWWRFPTMIIINGKAGMLFLYVKYNKQQGNAELQDEKNRIGKNSQGVASWLARTWADRHNVNHICHSYIKDGIDR
jgi:CRISPR/Cas system CMR-associated protein Cmr5 small subunit